MITINYVPQQDSYMVELFSKFKKEEAKIDSSLEVKIYLKGKTRVSISLFKNNTSESANICPAGSENLKLHPTNQTFIFDGQRVPHVLFQLSRKQHLGVLEQHLKNIIKQFMGLNDETPFYINVEESRDIRYIRQTFPAPATTQNKAA